MLIYFLNPYLFLYTKMVSTRKKRNQQKNQLIKLNETLNHFVRGSSTNVGAIGSETLEPQTNGYYNNLERNFECENSAGQN